MATIARFSPDLDFNLSYFSQKVITKQIITKKTISIKQEAIKKTVRIIIPE